MIDTATIDAIKLRTDIEEVVSDYVSLKRKGKNLWACCPFHNEKTPSFSISPEKGFYKCFGCGKGGDSIDFIMEIEKVSYVEALRYLANKYGIDIAEEAPTPSEIAEQTERESLLIALGFARDFFIQNLKETDQGQKIGGAYLKEREINKETTEVFELGYALDQWDILLKYGQEQGYSKDVLEKAGLLIVKESRVYDRFRGRIIFPVHNISGRVVAFGARTLKKDDKPKYINSPETLVYQKSEIVYGLYQAKQSIRRHENCFLVEGYTDVIRLHQIGIQNAVASSGTSLTKQQINLIGRFTSLITVLFDGDYAGMKASLRGIDMILTEGLDVKVVMFPEGEDPDSHARSLGSTEFQHFLEDQVQDFIHFKATLIARESGNDPVKRASGIKEIVSSISCIPDLLKRTVYLQEAGKMLGIEEKVLITEMNKHLLKDSAKHINPGVDMVHYPPESSVQPRIGINIDQLIAHQEKESMRLLLKYGFNKVYNDSSLYQFLFDELAEIEFITPEFREISSLFKQKLTDGAPFDADYFIEHGSTEVRKIVIDLVYEQHKPSTHWKDKFKIYIPEESEKGKLEQVAYTNILRLKQRVVRKLINENLNRLKETGDENEQVEFQQVHTELKTIEHDLARELGNVILK